MRLITIAALILSSGTAFAQERTFTVTLPESQWNYIGGVVGKEPYEKSADVLNSIRSQINTALAQTNAAEGKAMQDALAEIERLKSQQPKSEPQP
jgi:Arc/MetJ-type ribon-helix-helix transcriptional regulator